MSYVKYKYNQSMKKLGGIITRMAKLVQEKNQKNFEFVFQIQKEH